MRGHLQTGLHPLSGPWPPLICQQPRLNITMPPQQLSMLKMPMMWFCEMANSVMGKDGELLEHRHLFANPKT